MKSTAERLNGTYSIPRTDEDWKAAGYPTTPNFAVEASRGFYPVKKDDDGIGWEMFFLTQPPNWLHTEVPTQQLFDLMRDSIAPWRLEEDGFDIQDGITYFETVAGSFRIEANGEVSHIVTGRTANIETYTDLLTLIRLIG
jgi:hypothetical protein